MTCTEVNVVIGIEQEWTSCPSKLFRMFACQLSE